MVESGVTRGTEPGPDRPDDRPGDSLGPAPEAPSDPAPGPSLRVARNRQRQADRFLDAALRITVDLGFEALTMARLADEVDAAVGTVYRYYPSKADLMEAVQGRAIERLAGSFDRHVPATVVAVQPEVGLAARPLVPLVAIGRWACAAAVVLPEEVRLLQMVAARRTTASGPEGGVRLIPVVMDFVGRVVSVIDAAATDGVIDDGPALARGIMWLTGLGGVLEADDLEQYLPEVLGEQRLARQFLVDLVVGWGAVRADVVAVDAAIDGRERLGPLAG